MSKPNKYNGTSIDLLAKNSYKTLLATLENMCFDVQGKSFSRLYENKSIISNEYKLTSNILVSYFNLTSLNTYEDINKYVDTVIGISKLKGFDVYISETMVGSSENIDNIHLQFDTANATKKIQSTEELRSMIGEKRREQEMLYDRKSFLEYSNPEYIVVTGINSELNCQFNLVLLSHNSFLEKERKKLMCGEYSIYSPIEKIKKNLSEKWKSIKTWSYQKFIYS